MTLTGEVFDGEKFLGTKSIAIEENKIKEIRDQEESKGIILPGLIDAHIHFLRICFSEEEEAN
jgi:Amidohydrolase family.